MHRSFTAACGAGVSILLWASPALAHTEFEPSSANAGATVEFNLFIEDEDPAAATTRVELAFPDDVEVIVTEVPTPDGWTVDVDGEIGGPVAAITWEGGSEPDDVNFPLTLGPLPAEEGRLQFKIIQTYDDGEEVAWITDWPEGAEEPTNPGPVIDIVAADAPVTTASEEEEHNEETTEEPDDHDEDAAGTTATTQDELAAAPAETDDDESNTGIVVGGVVLIVVLAGGAYLVVRARGNAGNA